MDDLIQKYVIEYTYRSVGGLIRDRASHDENLPRIEATCQQAAEAKDYHFFDMLSHVVEHTLDRLAPPSCDDFKQAVKDLLVKYGPKGNEGVVAQEKIRFANFAHAVQLAGGSNPEAKNGG